MKAPFFLLLFVLCGAWAQVTYNNTNTRGCDAVGGCPFTEDSIWEGGKAPGPADEVFINATSSITLVVGAGQVVVTSITIFGDVTFWVSNGGNFTVSQTGAHDPTFSQHAGLLRITDHGFLGAYSLFSAGTVEIQTASSVHVGVMNVINSVSLTTSTLLAREKFNANTLSITESSFLCPVATIDYLYSTGDTIFATPPTVTRYANIADSSNLTLNGDLIIAENVFIEIHDCVSTISSVVFAGPNSTLLISAVTLALPNRINLVQPGTPPQGLLSIGGMVNVSIGSGGGNLQVGKGAVISVTDLQGFRIDSIQNDVNSPFSLIVNTMLTTASKPITLYASILLNRGVLITYAPLTVNSGATTASVYGDGYIQIMQGSFSADGNVVVQSLHFLGNGTLTAKNVNTSYIFTLDTSPVINAETALVTSGISLFRTLTFYGSSFTQTGGNLSIYFENTPPVFLQVEANLTISGTALKIDSEGTFAKNESQKFVLAQSQKGSISARFTQITDVGTPSVKITVSDEPTQSLEVVYGSYTPPPPEKKKSFWEKYEVDIVVGGTAGGVLVAVIIIVIVVFRRKRNSYEPL